MRAIDAYTLEKTIAEEFHGISATGFIRFMRDKTPIEVYNRVRDLIDKAPTVEPPEWQIEIFKRMVEEVRPKGKWEEKKTNPPEFMGHRFYICSKCGRAIDVITPDESLDDYPYCHCGARMIKEANND